MKKYILLTFYLSMVLTISIYSGMVQGDDENTAILEVLQDQEIKIDNWRNKALILGILTVVIGILGAVNTTAAVVDKKWSKVFIGASGISITIITIVINTFYVVDYRTYNNKADEAQKIVNSIKLKLAQGYNKNSEDDRNLWFDEINEKFNQIPELKKDDDHSVISISLISTASASTGGGDGEPEWLKNLPTKENRIYFIGISNSLLLSRAKDLSREDGVKEAFDYFLFEFKKKFMDKSTLLGSIDNYIETIVNLSRVVDTFYNYDKESGLYHYYSLLEFDKDRIDIYLSLSALKSRDENWLMLRKPTATLTSLPGDYYGKKVLRYKKISFQTKYSIRYEDYNNFITARELRKEGDFKGSINLLDVISQKDPTSYPAWYNLALSYDNIDAKSLANGAYQKAAYLVSKLDSKDENFYVAYADFLYRNGKYQEAFENSINALKINPHNSAAKNIQYELKLITGF